MPVSATSSLVAPTPHDNSNIFRRSANFHPTIWGDHFIQYVSEPMEIDEIMKQIVMLKEKVSKMLVLMNESATRPLEEANLIDSIQRLGLYHHFEHEIGEVLQHIHNSYVENGAITLNEDLHCVALVFRLLRQQGYHILPDVFKKFKNEQGNFNETLFGDVEGMISLFEVTHMRIHGEDILDEAFVFTSSHLEMMTPQLSLSLAAKVNHSLKWPLFKNLPRLVARYYISTYEEDPSHDATLLLLAKLDFNLLQKQHKKEAGELSKWWKDLDLETKFPFARNRIIELYFWSMGVYFEPQYSLGRRIMTKVLSLVSIIDDTYDVYGTIEELQLFTDAIERWDIKCMDFLPEYMKCVYNSLLDLYEEIEQEMAKEGRTLSAIYVKNELIRLVQSYFTEAKWFNSKYIPTVEEYVANGIVTSVNYLLTAISFIGMGSIATQETFRWLTNRPKIVSASCIIGRLVNDLLSNEKRGHVASAIECYMKQYGVSREDAINEISRQVTNAWKDINENLLHPIQVPKPLLIRVLNLTRAIDVMYKEEDGYTHSLRLTKNYIQSIMLNPCQI
ncbi:(-)-germacrene D synthase-like isoform X2 [Cicer arietinum]|uniref:(E)-beta-ocimene synthase n=1 Tax=Cicer arietinum TaxID=3827 RepID=A0A3Q7YD59_CICAR|nr:(-)-germacrene D synthase-like isoform X2 [Cicer arietinum]